MLWPLCSIKESQGFLVLLWGQVAVFIFFTHTRMRKRRGANCADSTESTERHWTRRLESESWSYHKSVQKLLPTKVYVYRFVPKTAMWSIFNRLHLNKASHARKHFLFLDAFSNKFHEKAFTQLTLSTQQLSVNHVEVYVIKISQLGLVFIIYILVICSWSEFSFLCYSTLSAAHQFESGY